MDYSPPGFSVHGIFQARILEWFAISFTNGSSQPRAWTRVSCTAGRFFIYWATREASKVDYTSVKKKNKTIITKNPVPWARGSSLVKRQRRAGTCVRPSWPWSRFFLQHICSIPLLLLTYLLDRVWSHTAGLLSVHPGCYGLISVCSRMPTPKSQCPVGCYEEVVGPLGGCLVHEGGVSALVKETPQSSPAPPATRGHNEKSEACKRVLSRTWMCWLFDRGLPDSTTLRGTFPSFLSSQSVVFCSSSLHRLGHRPGLLLSAVAPLCCNWAVSRVSIF